MPKIIIGVIGETGSGKDIFCDRVKKTVKRPVFCFRFSDPLSEILKILFGEVRKKEQQWLGKILRERYGKNILAKIIFQKIKSIKNGVIILNGIRYWEEFKMIKNQGGKILYITVDLKTRWQRIQSREEKKDDLISYKKFLKLEKAKTEISIPKIGKRADFKIENNGSLKDFYKNIKMILQKI